MRKSDRYDRILGGLKESMGTVQSELNFASPFQLLVAVMLSAQCTDKRVNLVTPALFEKYPEVDALAAADFEDVFPLISSVSYPRSKTEHLIATARKLKEDFGSEIPSDRDALMSLPGVGRKTANVVTAIAFGKAVIAVDTHVFRVAVRTGLSNGKNVEEVERDLTANICEEERADAHHYLLLHGRYVCTARSPHCGDCCIKDFCKHFSATKNKVKE